MGQLGEIKRLLDLGLAAEAGTANRKRSMPDASALTRTSQPLTFLALGGASNVNPTHSPKCR